MNSLSQNIKAACLVGEPQSKARQKALASIKWRLYSPELGAWAGLSGLQIVPFLDASMAQVFDGRDNEQTKLAFYSAATGIAWQVELL